MSVLYKALQRAQAENEQKTPQAPALDAQRLAGSGAILAAGRKGLTWKAGSIVAGVVLMVAVGGGLFLFGESETSTQTAIAPQPASLPVPQSTTAAVPVQAQPQAPSLAPPSQSSVEQVQVASVSQARQEAVATVTEAVQKSSGQEPESQAANSTETTGPNDPPARANLLVAADGIETAGAPTPLTPQARPASVSPGGSEPKANVSVNGAALPVSKPVPSDSPARVLNPPINIRRTEYEFAGVGDVVQVRQVSQQAQDAVGSGYNALVRGDYDMALGFYDRAIKQEPRSVMAQLGQAAAYHKLGRTDAARSAYERVLKIDPNNREALTNLTAIMADTAPNEALGRLVDLEREYPNFSPIKAQIGLIYAKTNQLDSAFQYLRQAVMMNPDAVLYRYNLALVLDRLGQKEQAVAAYRQTLDAASGRSPPGISVADLENRMRFLQNR